MLDLKMRMRMGVFLRESADKILRWSTQMSAFVSMAALWPPFAMPPIADIRLCGHHVCKGHREYQLNQQ
jgi:hypothetical protein